MPMEAIKKSIFFLKERKGLQLFLLIAFFIGFVYDVFFVVPAFSLESDMRLGILLLLWIFVSKISHFNSMATFKIAIGILMVMFVLFVFYPAHLSTERVGSWVYMFLLIGIIQQFFESRKK